MWPTEDAEMRRFAAGQTVAYLRRGTLSDDATARARCARVVLGEDEVQPDFGQIETD